MSVRRQWRSFDFVLAILVIGFALFGLYIIKFATAYDVRGLASIYGNQRLYLATGAALMLAAAFVDYHWITRLFIPIYVLCVILLVAVLFIGKDETGTARWIHLGFMNIQPSEFTKVFIILFLAKFIAKTRGKINNAVMLLLCLAFVAGPTLLVYKQPALSACLVIVVIGVGLIFVSGVNYKIVIAAAAVIIPIAAFVWWDIHRPEPFLATVLEEFQWKRVRDFINPEYGTKEYFQINASLRHIGSGMLSGVGLENGTYMTYGYNDFIFAVIGESLGFLGSIVTIAVIFAIIAKCLVTANMAADMEGRLIAAGVAVMLGFEVFVNVGVATSLLPNTGMPFPFLSSGGSTMWVHMIAIGLVLNVGLFKQQSFLQG